MQKELEDLKAKSTPATPPPRPRRDVSASASKSAQKETAASKTKAAKEKGNGKKECQTREVGGKRVGGRRKQQEEEVAEPEAEEKADEEEEEQEDQEREDEEKDCQTEDLFGSEEEGAEEEEEEGEGSEEEEEENDEDSENTKSKRGGYIPRVEGECSFAAARARLRRMREKKPTGRCHVPEAVHNMWKTGGADVQDQLVQMLRDAGWNKDALAWQRTYTKSVRAFFTHVEL